MAMDDLEVPRALREMCDPPTSLDKWQADLVIQAAEMLEEWQQSFEVSWNADMRGIKMWQEAHPGSELVWPDHAKLVAWLLDQIDELKKGPTNDPDSELREAAERTLSNNEKLRNVAEEFALELQDRFADYELLARYILATVREDDGEAIDEAWLESIGFKRDKFGILRSEDEKRGLSMTFLEVPGKVRVEIDEDVGTRREVAALIAALGVGTEGDGR